MKILTDLVKQERPAGAEPALKEFLTLLENSIVRLQEGVAMTIMRTESGLFAKVAETSLLIFSALLTGCKPRMTENPRSSIRERFFPVVPRPV
jgi:hypothetical protein